MDNFYQVALENAGSGRIPNRSRLRLGWMPSKVRGAILTMETAFYIIVIAILAAIAISTLVDTDAAKRTTTNQEIEQIRTAAVQYKAFVLQKKVTFSDGFTELFVELPADKSVDHNVHGPFLEPNSKNGTDGRWTITNGAKDLWGDQYHYDSKTNEIYSKCGSDKVQDEIRVYIGGDNK